MMNNQLWDRMMNGRTFCVVLLSSYFILGTSSQTVVAPATDTNDAKCHLNLIIPKEALSSCSSIHTDDVQEAFESEIAELKHEIQRLHVNEAPYTFTDNVRVLDRRKRNSQNNNKKTVKRLRNTKQTLSDEGSEVHDIDLEVTDLFNKKKLIKVFKFFIQKEIRDMRDSIKAEMFDEVRTEVRNEVRNEIVSYLQSSGINGKTAGMGQSETDHPTNIKDRHTDALDTSSNGPKGDGTKPEVAGNENGKKGLEDSLDSVTIVKIVKNGNFSEIQADQRFKRRDPPVVEQAIMRLTTRNRVLLSQHTEKVKNIIRSHGTKVGNEIQNIVSRIDNLENYLNDTVSRIHNNMKGVNLTNKFANIDHDLETLANEYHYLHDVAVRDKDVQQRMQVEIEGIVRSVNERLLHPSSPIKADINEVAERLRQAKESHDLKHARLETKLQNRLAGLVEKIHFMERNVSTVLGNIIEVNRNMTQSSTGRKCQTGQNCQTDGEESIGDADCCSKTANQLQVVMSALMNNLTALQENHQTDIETINESIRAINKQLHDVASSEETEVMHTNIREMMKSEVDVIQDKLTEIQKSYIMTTEKMKDFHDEMTENNDMMTYFRNNMLEMRETVEGLARKESERALANNEWVAYDFTHSSERNGCGTGKRYVKQTGFATGKYVGVVLCSPRRYKIYLSDKLTDMFLNIADTRQFGEDHCEFVGAKKDFTPRKRYASHYNKIKGYVRADWGETPKIDVIKSYNPSPLWYECGVSIPD